MKKTHKSPETIPTSRRALGWNFGGPLSAQDVTDMATDARVKLAHDVDFHCAAEEINLGLHLFAGATQTVGTPGEFEHWFEQIAKRLGAAIALFGEPGTQDREQAIRNFIERPSSCKAAGFDSFKLAELLRDVEKLTAAASHASGNVKKFGHRQKGSPRAQLESAFRAAWKTLTGAPHPTVTKAGNGPAGPFILFTSAALTKAAVQLAGSRQAAARATVPELRKLAGNPGSIAEWAGVRGKLVAKK